MRYLLAIMILTLTIKAQAFSLPIGKATCEIEGTDFLLKVDLRSTEVPESPFINLKKMTRTFAGSIELYKGDNLLISTVGAGAQTYTGKHFAWRYVGINQGGDELRIISPYGVDFAPYEITLTGKNLELELKDLDINCYSKQ